MTLPEHGGAAAIELSVEIDFALHTHTHTQSTKAITPHHRKATMGS
jgi:hypothetical protein